MGDPFFVIVILSILAVLVVLTLGLGGFAKGGAFNAKYSNKLMRLRLILQAVAVLLIVAYVWARNSGAQ